jgi:hypothetical protein
MTTSRQKIVKGVLYTEGETKHNHENMEKINLTRKVDKQMRSREKLNTTQKKKEQELIHTYVLVLFLNVNGLNSTIKNNRLIGLGLKKKKKKALSFVVYKKCTSLTKTNTA